MEESKLQSLATPLNSRNLSLRIQCLQDVLEFISEEGQIKPGLAKKLGRSILTAYFDDYYSEKLWISSLKSAMFQILHNFDFGDSIGEELIDFLRSKVKSDSSRLRSVELTLSLLTSLTKTFENGKFLESFEEFIQNYNWMIDLISLTGEGLDLLASTPLKQPSLRLLKTLSNDSPELFEILMRFWADLPPPNLPHVSHNCDVLLALLYPLLNRWSLRPTFFPTFEFPRPALLSRVQARINQVLVRKVFAPSSASQPSFSSSAVALETLCLYVSHLSMDQWTSPLSPSFAFLSSSSSEPPSDSLSLCLLKALKRSPDSQAMAGALILAALSFDFSIFLWGNGSGEVGVGSAVLGEWAAVAVRLIRSSDEAVREHGVNFFRTLLAKSASLHSASLLQSLLSVSVTLNPIFLLLRSLLDCLQGKSSLLNPNQRLGAIQALASLPAYLLSLVPFVGSSSLSPSFTILLSESLSVLLSLLEKDCFSPSLALPTPPSSSNSHSLAMVLVHCLSQWLPLASFSSPSFPSLLVPPSPLAPFFSALGLSLAAFPIPSMSSTVSVSSINSTSTSTTAPVKKGEKKSVSGSVPPSDNSTALNSKFRTELLATLCLSFDLSPSLFPLLSLHSPQDTFALVSSLALTAKEGLRKPWSACCDSVLALRLALSIHATSTTQSSSSTSSSSLSCGQAAQIALDQSKVLNVFLVPSSSSAQLTLASNSFLLNPLLLPSTFEEPTLSSSSGSVWRLSRAERQTFQSLVAPGNREPDSRVLPAWFVKGGAGKGLLLDLIQESSSSILLTLSECHQSTLLHSISSSSPILKPLPSPSAHSFVLPSSPSPFILRPLVWALLSDSDSVRRIAERNVQSFLSLLPSASPILLSVLSDLVQDADLFLERQSGSGLVKEEDMGIGKGPSLVSVPSPSRFIAALSSILMLNQTASHPHSSQTFLLSFALLAHPLLSPSSSRLFNNWNRTFAPLFSSSGPTFSSFSVAQDCAQSLLQLFLNTLFGAPSSPPTPRKREAALNMLLLCGQYIGMREENDEVEDERVSGHILSISFVLSLAFRLSLSSILTSLTENPELDSLTVQQIEMYQDPAASLRREVEAAESSLAQALSDLKITNADRKKDTLSKSNKKALAGTSFSSDLGEDQEWLEKVKKEKIEKLAKSTGIVGVSSEGRVTEEFLASKKTEFERERLIIDGLLNRKPRAILSLLKTMSNSSAGCPPAALKEALHLVLPALLRCLTSPLLGQQALQVLRGYQQVVCQDNIKPFVCDISDATWVVITTLNQAIPPHSTLSAGSARLVPQKSSSSKQSLVSKLHQGFLTLSSPVARVLRETHTLVLRAQAQMRRGGKQEQKGPLFDASTALFLVPILSSLLGFPMLSSTPSFLSLSPPILPHGCEWTQVVSILDALWPSAQVLSQIQERNRFSHQSRHLPSSQVYVHDDLSPYSHDLHRTLLFLSLICLSSPAVRSSDTSPETLFLRIATQLPLTSAQDFSPMLGDFGLLSEEANVRLICLRALDRILTSQAEGVSDSDEEDEDCLNEIERERLFRLEGLRERVWLSKHDVDPAVSKLGEQVWENLVRGEQMEESEGDEQEEEDEEEEEEEESGEALRAGQEGKVVGKSVFKSLRPLLSHPSPSIRQAAASSLADALSSFPSLAPRFFQSLLSLHLSHLPPPPILRATITSSTSPSLPSDLNLLPKPLFLASSSPPLPPAPTKPKPVASEPLPSPPKQEPSSLPPPTPTPSPQKPVKSLGAVVSKPKPSPSSSSMTNLSKSLGISIGGGKASASGPSRGLAILERHKTGAGSGISLGGGGAGKGSAGPGPKISPQKVQAVQQTPQTTTTTPSTIPSPVPLPEEQPSLVEEEKEEQVVENEIIQEEEIQPSSTPLLGNYLSYPSISQSPFSSPLPPHLQPNPLLHLLNEKESEIVRTSVACVIAALGQIKALPARYSFQQPVPFPSPGSGSDECEWAENQLAQYELFGDRHDLVHFLWVPPLTPQLQPLHNDCYLAPRSTSELLVSLFKFILKEGVTDPSSQVREAFLAAGRALVDGFGKSLKDEFLGYFNSELNSSPPDFFSTTSASSSGKKKGKELVSAPTPSQQQQQKWEEEELDKFDRRHEAAVIFLGGTGKHLEKDDPSISRITDTLILALRTPSESVQVAVSDCLASLSQTLKGTEKSREVIEYLYSLSLKSNSYGERRGAGMGLGAWIKGSGLPSLKQHDLIPRLKDACSSSVVEEREGALMILEALSLRLGLLFEPFVITLIPILLKCLSHTSDHVRQAAQDTSKAIMSRLSAHGVKQVMQPVLNSLPTETQWKARQEALRLLGSMAHCSPKTLSSCLPQVVPRLVEASSDPHPKVKETARQAMQEVSQSIRSPELRALSPHLLAAIAEPATKMKDALEALLDCEFVHAIDPPSLALLVPILARALKDRTADIKRKGSAIAGNMVEMVTDIKAISPYLGQLLPGLKDCLVDPIPDVRAASARALASLIEGAPTGAIPEGEDRVNSQEQIIAWLLETMCSEVSPVNRSGAAQGLAEVSVVLGEEKTEEVLSEVLPLQHAARSGAREGLLWLLSFLPLSLGEEYGQYISRTLPVVLRGLSDENEGVREVALRAGQVTVNRLGKTHFSDLLPSLLEAMFHPDHRIRYSSVTLLGDLLYLVADTKAIGMTDVGGDEDDDARNISSSSKVLITIRSSFGDETTNQLLASLYIVRSDVSNSVRQIALQVWKSVVANTPRTLVEIMSSLVSQLISLLSSPSPDLRAVAGRALGEVVRKQGERVLPSVLPHLRENLATSEEESERLGVVLGLTEIFEACTSKQVSDFGSTLIPTLVDALCDSFEDVRLQAGESFLTLIRTVGRQAVELVVPTILERLEAENEEEEDNENDNDEDEEEDVFSIDALEKTQVDREKEEEVSIDEESLSSALLGLRVLVSVRSRDLLDFLVPSLTQSPLRPTAARALRSVVGVAGQGLNYHFAQLLPSCINELILLDQNIATCKGRILQCQEQEGSDSALDRLVSELKSLLRRISAVKSLASELMASTVSSGVLSLTQELGKLCEHESDEKKRKWGCWLVEKFVSRSEALKSDFVPILLRFLLGRVAEVGKDVLETAKNALLAISTSTPLEELAQHIPFILTCLSSTASDARHRGSNAHLFDEKGEFRLPIFTLPKSLDPFLNIFIHGLMNGSTQLREQSADAMSEVISMSDPSVLRPLLVKTTGPLIRIVGERFPSSVKTSILKTLCVLLDRGGAGLRAFVPQLQTSFVKNLSDPSRATRSQAALGLGKLMALSARVDPLLGDLANACGQAESNAIRSSILDALTAVLTQGGEKATAPVLDKISSQVLRAQVDDDESVRAAATQCLSPLGCLLQGDPLSDLVFELLEAGGGLSVGEERLAVLSGRLVGLAVVLQSAGQKAETHQREEVVRLIEACLRDRRVQIQTAACNSLSFLLSLPKGLASSVDSMEARKAEFRSFVQPLLRPFLVALVQLADGDPDEQSELKIAALSAIKNAAKSFPVLCSQFYSELVDVLLSCVRGVNMRVKYVAERALRHLFDGGRNPVLLASYSSLPSTHPNNAAFLRDYAKRVLVKMNEDSDEEDL